jgi:hypothetical protein
MTLFLVKHSTKCHVKSILKLIDYSSIKEDLSTRRTCFPGTRPDMMCCFLFESRVHEQRTRLIRARGRVSVGSEIYVDFLVNLSRRSGPLIEKIICDRSVLDMCF